MALNATIFKVTLNIADMDRAYYGEHMLTIARHPSETDERMMVRILAFILHAHETLSFGRGLSSDDEPDLWRKDLTGTIETWIDVGQPDEKRMRKACSRAAEVYVYAYGGHGATLWWHRIRDKIQKNMNLTVIALAAASTQALAKLAQRKMQLHCTIEDGQIWIGDDKDTVAMELSTLLSPGTVER